jgi:sugar lactone lactonase YvrE
MRRLMLIVALLALLPTARAGDEDYYISIPAFGAIYLLDAETGTLTPWASGFGIPFYGVWADDGFLYMPDRALGAIFKIDTAGNVVPFAAGGFLGSPVTVVQAPDGSLVAADIFNQTIVRLDPLGNQTLISDVASSGGMLNGPGGIAYGPDGVLYVSNNVGNNIVAIDEVADTVTLVGDGGGLLIDPGGISVDGAGNLYVANYSSNNIVRIRLDTGEGTVFCDDPFMISPNDVKLGRDGGLNVTTKNSSLVHIDALGQLTLIKQDQDLGDWDGVAVPADFPGCDGSFTPYGVGTPGSGGIVPRLGGIFSPCPGASVALEFDRNLGNAQGFVAWGAAPLSAPLKGGTLLVDIGAPGGLIPLPFPGSGPGGGSLTLPFTLPDLPIFAGADFYLQTLVWDAGAPGGVAFSNGLHEHIGN